MTWRQAILFGGLASLALAQSSLRQIGETTLLSRRLAGQRSNSIRVDSNDDAYLGITIWRLSPSSSSDDPAVRVKLEGGKEWTPARVSDANPLSSGDRIRISI